MEWRLYDNFMDAFLDLNACCLALWISNRKPLRFELKVLQTNSYIDMSQPNTMSKFSKKVIDLTYKLILRQL